MDTNLAIDPELLERALAIGGERPKTATVTVALEEYFARRTQAKIIEHFHTIDDWNPYHDYKAERSHHDHKLGLSG